MMDVGKAHVLTASYNGAVIWNSIERSQRTMVAEPVRVGTMPSPNGELKGGQAMRIYDIDGKAVTLKGQGGGSGAERSALVLRHSRQRGDIQLHRRPHGS